MSGDEKTEPSGVQPAGGAASAHDASVKIEYPEKETGDGVVRK